MGSLGEGTHTATLLASVELTLLLLQLFLRLLPRPCHQTQHRHSTVILRSNPHTPVPHPPIIHLSTTCHIFTVLIVLW